MEGVALSKFDESAQVHGAETLGHYKETIGDWALYIFPTRALQVQKCYMHHHMRKSPYMKMKECMVQVEELNNYLKMFSSYQQGIELQMTNYLISMSLEYHYSGRSSFSCRTGILNIIINKSFWSFVNG
jgi:hypothetical protein